ncbi:chaperone required for assembly of F1-ATPase [Rhodovulum imhoffii]|uniref:Chaperone required for assembly of F1-ATPase n=1 Tax=Rhodovulum imhoffii TaxID=365340 RepID=A0A2T5BRX5_9RHOB|nr:ATP12 family protein [Rhodovulum imhoffii]MBK5932528.1 ATPase [Rhodovulum imhoffii]PTN02060.1 chaperone required for assembly of F1-ATPase [Rhodovulum imhoffii]
MAEWAPKRFWKAATVEIAEPGFAVSLDGRRVKTPAKAALIVPSRAMAQAIAAEWAAQGERLDPGTMPVTRAANAAIDKVAVQHGEVADMIAAYGETDLTCHRAEGPEVLCARQSAAWDPLLDWAHDVLGARLCPACGVIPTAQPPESLAALRTRVRALDTFELTALHDLVGLSGSLLIGLAAFEGWARIEALWDISRIDETWQEEQWGRDEDAAAASALKRKEFLQARRFLDLHHAQGRRGSLGQET